LDGVAINISAGAASETHILSDTEAMRSGSVWTENELSNTIKGGWLKPTSDTETRIEAPNIIGDNITITTSGGIGSDGGERTIDFSNVTELSDDDRIALAAAERDDLTIIDAENDFISFGTAHGLNTGDAVVFPGFLGLDNIGGVNNNQTYYAVKLNPTTIKLSDSYANAIADQGIIDLTRSEFRLNLRDDVDLQTSDTGVINVSAGGYVYLGSEIDMSIDQIASWGGGDIRLKGGDAIVNAADTNDANVIGGDTILEAANDNIGAADNFLTTDLSPGATLTARSADNIYIHEIQGNMNIDTLYAPHHIDVRAQGSMLDAFDSDALNIKTKTLYFEAGGNVGASNNFLDIDMDADGHVDGKAGGNIYLFETVADMNVGIIESTGGDVSLKAAFSILDYEATGIPGSPAPDIHGNNITLEAIQGGIGAPGDDLDINTVHSGPGKLTSSSIFDQYIIETTGDLTIKKVISVLGTTYIFTPGSILDGNTEGVDVDATWARFTADTGSIGKPGDFLDTELDYVEGRSGEDQGDDGIWVLDHSDLTVGGVSSTDGLHAGGPIIVTAMGPMFVEEDVISDDFIILTAQDAPDSGQDLIVDIPQNDPGNPVLEFERKISGTAVILRGGDNVHIVSGSLVEAETTVTVEGDFGNADTGEGTVILVNGSRAAHQAACVQRPA
jgi:hypothetical protein